jgi:hypothetical protein
MYYNGSVHLNFYMPDVAIAISITAPSVDVDLPRLSLELEFLISGYWCFEDWEGNTLLRLMKQGLLNTLCFVVVIENLMWRLIFIFL